MKSKVFYILSAFLITLLGSCSKDENKDNSPQTTIDGWTVETANADVSVSNGIIRATLDDQGKVHICYFDEGGAQSTLKYTTNKSGSWKTQTIATSNSDKYFVGATSGIAVDNNGNVNIAYAVNDNNNFDDTNYSAIVYTNNASSQWTAINIFPAAGMDGMFYDCDLKMDAQNKIHISAIYSGDINGVSGNYIIYAGNSSGQWVTETVTKELEFEPAIPALSIDGSNIPHIGYVQNDQEDVYAATRLGAGNWDNHLLVKNAGQGGSQSMFVSDVDLTTDANGNESAIFNEIEQGKFWLFYQDQLSFLALDQSGNIGKPKILSDKQGNIHYLYGIVDSDYYILMYGSNTSGSFLVDQILGFNAYSGNSILLYNSTDKTVYIIYCDQKNKLMVAHKSE